MSKTTFLVCIASFVVAAVPSVAVPTTIAQAAGSGTIGGKIVAPRQRMLPNAVVYVVDAPGTFTPRGVAVMDQKGKRFVPHVLPILEGTTVRFDNSDPLVHNVFTPDGGGYDLGAFGLHETRTHTFDKVGVYTQLCRLHVSMLAYIVVLPNPYFALTDDEGRFRIRHVPPGHYQLRAWQEHAYGGPVDVVVQPAAVARVQIPVTE